MSEEVTTTETTTEAAPAAPTLVGASAPTYTPLTAGDLTVEGLDLSGDFGTKFLAFAAERQLDKDSATSLLNLHSEALSGASEAMAATLREKLLLEQTAEWDRTQETWLTEAKALPDIGGDKLDATLSSVAKLLDKFGDSKVREAFDLTGAGNNPHMIRFLHKMSLLLNEKTPVSASPTGSRPSLEKFYSKGA